MYQSTFSQLPKITLDYLEYGAPEGQRDEAAYRAAQQFFWNGYSIDEAMAAIVPRAIQDGLSPSQAEKCVRSGYKSKPGDPIGRTESGFYRTHAPAAKLPDPILNGDEQLLLAAFNEGEIVAIGDTFESERDERHPAKGLTFTREDWLQMIREKGSINKSMSDKHGLYIRINPMVKGGSKNDDVTEFRHALIEADTGSKEEQYGKTQKMGLPITAIIDSMGRSIHAWVRIDAKSQVEYEHRVAILHKFCLESLGMELDQQNKNASRYSRMPNGNRTVNGVVVQPRLLQLNVEGVKWEEWEPAKQIAHKEFWENPEELLISGSVTVSLPDTAKRLYLKMAESQEYFVRGKNVTTISPTNSGGVEFSEVTAQEMRNIAPKLFKKVVAVGTKKNEEGKDVFLKKNANISSDLASGLLGATDEKRILPAVNIITASPVLYEDPETGDVVKTRTGYNADIMGGAFVTGGESIRPDTLDEAKANILELFEDFLFVTEGDRTRRIAMAITPAFHQAGLIKGHVPIDFAEANESQPGKTLQHQIVTAIYGEQAALVTQRDGGVGSFDESLGEAYLKGRPFVKMDNLKRTLDSTILEAMLTADHRDLITVRAFRKAGEVAPGLFIHQASTNGLLGTRDFMNRSVVTRIRQNPKDKKYHHPDILEHIRSHQGKYLGSIHRIIEEWIVRGKKESVAVDHDFKQWARKLDWVMSHIFGRTDMLNGHRAIQMRNSTPILVTMRQIAIVAKQEGKLGQELSASELVELAEENGIDMKGRDDEGKRKSLGIALSKVFVDTEKVDIDEFRVVRVLGKDYKGDQVKFYRFETVDHDPDPF
jgi:hypothetical protein